MLSDTHQCRTFSGTLDHNFGMIAKRDIKVYFSYIIFKYILFLKKVWSLSTRVHSERCRQMELRDCLRHRRSFAFGSLANPFSKPTKLCIRFNVRAYFTGSAYVQNQYSTYPHNNAPALIYSHT